MRRAATALACAIAAFGADRAAAQDLPRLHVTALGMHADHKTVTPGQTYHIVIHVHVTQRRERLDELVLPTLGDATDLGDERRESPAPDGGTDFYEIMTVSSPGEGRASFSPAYIDAIDPAVGRGMRYSSQSVSVRVVGAVDRAERRASHALRDLALFAALALAVLSAALWLVLRRKPARSRETIEAAPALRPPGAPDALAAAVAAVRAHADDTSLDALRNVLFVRAGARPGATLADASAALGDRRPELLRVMTMAERARFGPRAQRPAATHDLLDALDPLLREPVAR